VGGSDHVRAKVVSGLLKKGVPGTARSVVGRHAASGVDGADANNTGERKTGAQGCRERGIVVGVPATQTVVEVGGADRGWQ
jgi:hypothetical protein